MYQVLQLYRGQWVLHSVGSYTDALLEVAFLANRLGRPAKMVRSPL